MKLQILTPDKSVFDGEVDALLVPGASGPFLILKGHAPILSSLIQGEVRITANGKETYYTVSGGFVEFHQNQGVVLAESADDKTKV